MLFNVQSVSHSGKCGDRACLFDISLQMTDGCICLIQPFFQCVDTILHLSDRIGYIRHNVLFEGADRCAFMIMGLKDPEPRNIILMAMVMMVMVMVMIMVVIPVMMVMMLIPAVTVLVMVMVVMFVLMVVLMVMVPMLMVVMLVLVLVLVFMLMMMLMMFMAVMSAAAFFLFNLLNIFLFHVPLQYQSLLMISFMISRQIFSVPSVSALAEIS